MNIEVTVIKNGIHLFTTTHMESWKAKEVYKELSEKFPQSEGV